MGGSYERDVVEICDNQIDDNGDGKADCDDQLCSGFHACQPKVAPTVDDSAAIAIDLSNPQSASNLVSISEKKGKLSITITATQKTVVALSGAYDGTVSFKNPNDVDVDVILNNVTITSKNAAGNLKLNTDHKKKGNAYVIKLVGKNTLEGNNTKDSNKVLSCDANLDIIGEGSLDITARYKTAVKVDDVLRIWSGTLNLNIARDKADNIEEKGFGMKIDNGFYMAGGDVTVTGRDGIEKFESRGIKVDGDEDNYGAGKGYIVIAGGNLTIETDGKALSAGWDKSEDAKTDDTSDDPYPDLTITGGNVKIHTYTEPREGRMGPPPGMGRGFGQKNNDGTDNTQAQNIPTMPQNTAQNGNTTEETNTISPEGLEAKGHINLLGGNIHVIATDDAINAGGTLTIAGGNIYTRSTDNDSIDSNGKIVISGGMVMTIGSSEPEGGLDADSEKNVSYTGGIVVAMGGENNHPGTVENGNYVQLDVVESERGKGGPGGKPPHMRDQNDGSSDDQESMRGPGGPGGGPGMPPGKREKTLSKMAGKTYVLVKDNEVILAAKVPADYMGGGNLLMIGPTIEKDVTYTLLEDPELEPSDLTWFDDAILLSTATVKASTGNTIKEVKGGEGSRGMFDGGPDNGDRPLPPWMQDQNQDKTQNADAQK